MVNKPWKELLVDYDERSAKTDRLPPSLEPVLLGLFGEAGSVMAPAKKLYREGASYIQYVESAEEEFGDLLWYFAALLRRLGVPITRVFSAASYAEPVRLGGDLHTERNVLRLPISPVDEVLIELGLSTSVLASIDSETDKGTSLSRFAQAYAAGLAAIDLSFSQVIERNLQKIESRFLDPVRDELPTFDSSFDPDERLPNQFAITFKQRPSGKCHLAMNGVFIGDPLTDNISDRDGYRFHDVFHMAYAAILHWSPVMRSLLQRKRKSNPFIDETEDGGRASVIEEGVSAYLFAYAKQVDFFANATAVPYDLLKQIARFVRGYEVAQCPLRLWEIAILEGYAAFRELHKAQGGVIRGDRRLRTLLYEPQPR